MANCHIHLAALNRGLATQHFGPNGRRHGEFRHLHSFLFVIRITGERKEHRVVFHKSQCRIAFLKGLFDARQCCLTIT